MTLPRWCPIVLALACHPAVAGALQLPPPPAVRFEPASGARLPADVPLRDEQGREAPLSSWLGRTPVVLVPGYYRCPNLCSTLFEGVLQAMTLSGLRADEYRLLGVSIDPHEGAAEARQRRAAYAGLLPAGGQMAMLTGGSDALARIESALGYTASRDGDGGQLAHAAGFVVAAPDGRIVRLFPGVRFDPKALRDTVRTAAAGQRAGDPPSLGQRLLLLCAHYDPAVGRNTPLALAVVRGAALLVLAALAAALWRWHARRNGKGSAA